MKPASALRNWFPSWHAPALDINHSRACPLATLSCSNLFLAEQPQPPCCYARRPSGLFASRRPPEALPPFQAPASASSSVFRIWLLFVFGGYSGMVCLITLVLLPFASLHFLVPSPLPPFDFSLSPWFCLCLCFCLFVCLSLLAPPLLYFHSLLVFPPPSTDFLLGLSTDESCIGFPVGCSLASLPWFHSVFQRRTTGC